MYSYPFQDETLVLLLFLKLYFKLFLIPFDLLLILQVVVCGPGVEIECPQRSRFSRVVLQTAGWGT